MSIQIANLVENALALKYWTDEVEKCGYDKDKEKRREFADKRREMYAEFFGQGIFRSINTSSQSSIKNWDECYVEDAAVKTKKKGRKNGK